MSWLRYKGVTHYPVLHREVSQLVAEYLELVEDSKPQVQMFDGTFGGGGHSAKLLEQHPNLKILGTDLDYSLLEQCRHEYAHFIKKRRLALEHTNFVNIPAIDLKTAFNRKITVKDKFDIGLLDLGFSNFQVTDSERGFSYLPENDDSVLDM